MGSSPGKVCRPSILISQFNHSIASKSHPMSSKYYFVTNSKTVGWFKTSPNYSLILCIFVIFVSICKNVTYGWDVEDQAFHLRNPPHKSWNNAACCFPSFVSLRMFGLYFCGIQLWSTSCVCQNYLYSCQSICTNRNYPSMFLWLCLKVPVQRCLSLCETVFVFTGCTDFLSRHSITKF